MLVIRFIFRQVRDGYVGIFFYLLTFFMLNNLVDWKKHSTFAEENLSYGYNYKKQRGYL